MASATVLAATVDVGLVVILNVIQPACRAVADPVTAHATCIAVRAHRYGRLLAVTIIACALQALRCTLAIIVSSANHKSVTTAAGVSSRTAASASSESIALCRIEHAHSALIKWTVNRLRREERQHSQALGPAPSLIARSRRAPPGDVIGRAPI